MNTDRCFGEVANIGTGHEISIGETVELLSDLMGVSVTVIKTICENGPLPQRWSVWLRVPHAHRNCLGGNQNMQGARDLVKPF